MVQLRGKWWAAQRKVAGAGHRETHGSLEYLLPLCHRDVELFFAGV